MKVRGPINLGSFHEEGARNKNERKPAWLAMDENRRLHSKRRRLWKDGGKEDCPEKHA